MSFRAAAAWSLRDPPPRRGGHGRGVPRPGHAAGPGRGRQGLAGAVHGRPRAPAAVRAGGPGGGGPKPSQYPRLTTWAPTRARPTSSPNCSRGRRSGNGCAKAPSRRQGGGTRCANRPGPRGGPREGHRPPRHEAREPLHHGGRPGEDPRLRPGPAQARGALARRGPTEAPTVDTPTREGSVLGTVGYMSPERNPLPPGCGRHGRGVQGPGYQAWPRRGRQSAAGGARGGPRAPAPVRAGGEGNGRAGPPQHPCDS